MTRIVLVRHGQTEWNAFERFRGHADIPLDETGRRQAAATARKVHSTWKLQAIYSSPLSRALATAEAIDRLCSITVQTHPGLADIDYGAWQGLTPAEVRSRWPGLLDSWYAQPHTVRIPGGESLDELRRRCGGALAELAAKHSGAAIALVAHTAVNRVLLLVALGLGNDRFWRLRQDTCAINEIEADAADYTLVSMNDTCHLRASGA